MHYNTLCQDRNLKNFWGGAHLGAPHLALSALGFYSSRIFSAACWQP